MSDFETLFNDYKTKAGIANDRDVCALLSKALETYKPDQQLKLLDDAIKKNYDINMFVLRLGVRADVSELKTLLETKAKGVPAVPDQPVSSDDGAGDPGTGSDQVSGQLPLALPLEPSLDSSGQSQIPPNNDTSTVGSNLPGDTTSSDTPPASDQADASLKPTASEEQVAENKPDSEPVTPAKPERPALKRSATAKKSAENGAVAGLKGWFVGAKDKVLSKWPKKQAPAAETSANQAPAKPKVSEKLSETGAQVGKFVASRWQTFVIIGVALLFILGIASLGPANTDTGQHSFQTTGAPINSLPVVVFFVFVITFPLFFEASQRGDLSDAFVVLLCLVMSSVAAAYETEWSSITFSSGRPLGAYLIGALYLTPYPLLWQAASTNKTKNVFGLKALSKYDFSPVFNTLLLFWAAAKTHVYWPWLPNPCFFPENFYLIAGVSFMFLELAGNIYNLLFSVIVGVSSGYLIFDDERFWWIFVVYLALVLYASTDKATKEITMNVDNKPTGVGEGGTSFGSGVRTKRFVPYDLLTGALWITAITAVVWYGNPSFPIVLPF